MTITDETTLGELLDHIDGWMQTMNETISLPPTPAGTGEIMVWVKHNGFSRLVTVHVKKWEGLIA